MGSSQSSQTQKSQQSQHESYISQQQRIIQAQQEQIRQLSQMNLQPPPIPTAPLPEIPEEPQAKKPKVKLDPYKILSLSKQYDETSLKKAYFKAALQTHPDRGGDHKEFQKVSIAYAVLKKKQHAKQLKDT